MDINVGNANLTIIGLFGLFFFLIGCLFFFSGLGIVKLPVAEVQPGRKNWVAGLLLLALGVLLIGIDLRAQEPETAEIGRAHV